ncbi:aspartic peptidase domain-containing protein [Lentinula aciculospora]|uniref:Aspartic peptidase domain-containing protein n=1 Tax=Lentinula aciculospora TaxID=153920 RepID=A0A9W8ZVS9_9AGAR|nr:aspartic peptidase domain-containing protein [Lentinula aciculospora]
MKVALAFFVVLCATLLIPLGHCNPLEFTNIIPISRRSLLNRRALEGDFDATLARDEQQTVYQKYLNMFKILNGTIPVPENDIDDFVQSKYVDEVAPDTDTVLEQVVGPVDVSDVLLTIGMTDAIVNEVDMLYYGGLSIGTPGQELTFDIDTGSADLWVPSPWCGTKNHYDSSQSSTYADQGRRFAVSYASGTVYGTTASDTVMIAGTAIQNQTFGIVYRESQDFQAYPNDGLLGMAFGTIAHSRGLTVFETMMKQGKLKWPCFSVHLTRAQHAGSELCWGCFDPTKATGPINWFPVSRRAYWSIAMSGFDVAGERTTFDEMVISAIDTGTTFCYFPEPVAAEIYAQIPGSKDASATYGSGFYTYPCTSQVDIGFVFGDVTFRLHPGDFNLGMSMYNPAECLGGIFAMDAAQWPPNLAIIGDEFLKSWYSVYDYSDGGRVGFAPSVNNQ